MAREYVIHRVESAVNLRIDYAAELNEQQYQAVTAAPGPSLVIAGAGSGKTRTLTYRVAYLLEHDVPPESILLLTFTNKAAREMMRRVADLIGAELGHLWGGTFHSIGARILRRHAEVLGFRPDYTILDRDDAEALLKVCVGEAPIDVKATRFPKAEVLADMFSMAVNTQRSVREVLAQDFDLFLHLAPQIQDIAQRYAERKRTNNSMDFDDLLVLWLKLLRDDQAIRERYQRQFQYLLVDEYQDTNKLQADLIDLIAAQHHNVMVVGDDSQSIYAWRGANFRNIMEFPKRHAGAKVFKIETNYRSTPEILSVANAAIAANTEQFTKKLKPARPSGEKPALVTCNTSQDQAEFVAQRMLELREEGIALENMAVLYRSHFHALELQLELTRRNIPFLITSGIRVFEQAHMKDVAAYLKLLCNPNDELSFKRLALMLPGIGGKGADKLWQSFQEAWTKYATDPETPVAKAVQSIADAVPKKAKTAWSEFAIVMSQLEAPEVRQSASKMIRLVIEAGYGDYVEENFKNYRARLDELEQLSNFALNFETPEDFLAQLSLLTNLEAEDETARARRDDERVRLTTIHQAKGLEFDVVFVIMLCDGLFPSQRASESPEGEEEERRLFYVAVTRAKQQLYLCHPIIRLSPGYGGDAFQQPSRFLSEIPKTLVDQWNLRADPF